MLKILESDIYYLGSARSIKMSLENNLFQIAQYLLKKYPIFLRTNLKQSKTCISDSGHFLEKMKNNSTLPENYRENETLVMAGKIFPSRQGFVHPRKPLIISQ